MRYKLKLIESKINEIVESAVKQALKEGSAESCRYAAAINYYKKHGHFPGQTPYDDSEDREYESKKEKLRQMVKNYPNQIEGKYVEASNASQGGSGLATHIVRYTNYKDYSVPYRLEFVHWGKMRGDENNNSIPLSTYQKINRMFDSC